MNVFNNLSSLIAKRLRRFVPQGVSTRSGLPIDCGLCHVRHGRKNTLFVLSTCDSKVISWVTCGSQGFRNSRKSSSHACETAARALAHRAKEKGIGKILLRICGVGRGKFMILRYLQQSFLEILEIQEVTRLPHNGCRRKKTRRT